MPTTELLQAISVAAVVVAGLYRWSITRFRSQLKDDLEILKRYSELFDADSHSTALRRSIQQSMRRAYELPAIERRALTSGLFATVFGVLNFVVERPPSVLAVIAGTLGLIIGPASIIAAIVAPRDL